MVIFGESLGFDLSRRFVTLDAGIKCTAKRPANRQGLSAGERFRKLPRHLACWLNLGTFQNINETWERRGLLCIPFKQTLQVVMDLCVVAWKHVG